MKTFGIFLLSLCCSVSFASSICADFFSTNKAKAITMNTISLSSSTQILMEIGRELTSDSEGHLQVVRLGHIEYQSDFNPITSLRVYQGAENQVYLVIWSLGLSINNFKIVAFNGGEVKTIDVQNAPNELIESARKGTYSPPLGRITIESVDVKTEDYYVHYKNSLGESQAIWMNARHMKKLMNAAQVKSPDQLKGFNRVIVAPEGSGGVDLLVDKLSGLWPAP